MNINSSFFLVFTLSMKNIYDDTSIQKSAIDGKSQITIGDLIICLCDLTPVRPPMSVFHPLSIRMWNPPRCTYSKQGINTPLQTAAALLNWRFHSLQISRKIYKIKTIVSPSYPIPPVSAFVQTLFLRSPHPWRLGIFFVVCIFIVRYFWSCSFRFVPFFGQDPCDHEPS